MPSKLNLTNFDSFKKCYFCNSTEYETDLFFDTNLKVSVCESCFSKSQDLDRQIFHKRLKENPSEILKEYVPAAYLNSYKEPFYHSKKDFVKSVLEKVLDKNGGDIWIQGINNTGKTKLIWISFINLVLSGVHPSSILVVKTYDMKEDFIQASNEKTYFDVKKYMNIQILMIDDLVAINLTPAFSGVLFAILDYRFENRLKTIVTTDADFKDILKCDQRLAARIERFKNKFQTDKSKIL